MIRFEKFSINPRHVVVKVWDSEDGGKNWALAGVLHLSPAGYISLQERIELAESTFGALEKSKQPPGVSIEVTNMTVNGKPVESRSVKSGS